MAAEKDAKYAPLLRDDESETDIGLGLVDARLAQVWRRRFYRLLGASVLLCSALGFAAIFAICHRPRPASGMHGVQQPYSPIRDEIRYVNKHLGQDPDTPRFMGAPRPEMDEAWHELLAGTLLHLSEEDLERVNSTSLRSSKGGYVGGLGLSHNLHCVKRLKQYMYPEYYYAHKEQDWDALALHADHCLESLRKALLCQPDLSLYTLGWTTHSREKPAVGMPQAHACVDWSQVHDWMIEHAADYNDMEGPPPGMFDEE